MDGTAHATDAVAELKDMKHDQLGDLYNGMIHPLIPFAIRGAIWYQGEANDGHPSGGLATIGPSSPR